MRKYKPKLGSKKLRIPDRTPYSSAGFEQYCHKFDMLNGLKSINYTFGEKK